MTSPGRASVPPLEHSVEVPAGGVSLAADVAVPEAPAGAVLFAHGTGSGRHSPRNRYVAGQLRAVGLATVLADLLTPAEARVDSATGQHRFDVALLAARVVALVDWCTEQRPTGGLPIGLFGASTGAAAALVAAASRPDAVAAVVSRGGRPDLAEPVLHRVHQPTLLVVGERDEVVVELNQRALRGLVGESHLAVIPGATHLFEERGALEQVAELARAWFTRHLGAQPRPDP